MQSENSTKHLPLLSESDKDRFFKRVQLKSNRYVCWDWVGRKNKKGYGAFDFAGKSFSSHRIAYFLNSNKDPFGLCVLHKCDNPKCVNPNHLFLGTNYDNVRDKVKKGRQAFNTWANVVRTGKYRLWDNKRCKANKDQFIEMKDIYEKGGRSLSDIGKEFGISKRALAKGIRKLGGFVPIHTTMLSKDIVLEIRKKYDSNKRNGIKLAKEYNIGNKTIMDIVRRKTWKNI